jgi:hypothetical protein
MTRHVLVGTAGLEREVGVVRLGQARKCRHGLISIIHLLFFLWLKKITSTKKQHLLDEELKLKPQVKS